VTPVAGTLTDAPFWTGITDAAAFARVQDERIARARAAIARITAVTGPRTIENTLAPYDEIVLELDTAGSQASLIENVHPDQAVRDTAERVSQQVAAVATELSLNRPVYDALAAIDLAGADPETRYYVERTLRDFRLSGVDRDETTRTQIAKLRDELVEIGQEFSRNIRSDRRSVTVKDAAQLAGLPEDYIARHPAGPDGTITISTDYPDALPVFTYAESDSLRHDLYMEFNNRAYPSNVAVLQRLLEKRHELARLLGFASYAELVMADKMVGSGLKVSEFIDHIVALSGRRATEEYEMLLRHKRAREANASQVNAWEAGYWSEQWRRSEYEFDAQSVRPYFPYARVQAGALDVASKLFGVTFTRVDAPVWHPAVECWEMREGDALVGRFYLDMHPREDKYRHAAEFDVRTGVAGRQLPEAALVCNFPGGEPGDPGLMEHSDVRTLFHELGHLLHGLFAGRRRWTGTGGIRTENDFIEVPSQLFEEWVWDPRVLATFARHHETDEPIPAEMVERMRRASEFGKGLGVRRQMVYARVSLDAFDRDPQSLDLDQLVERIQDDYTPFPHVAGTHLQCSFGHLEGYSAGYYTYMWSLVIEKDFFDRFGNDLLDPAMSMKYRKTVLEPGGSAPAAQLVRDFLGRDFSFDAYQEWLERN
jgi:thimet oligopeptidase